MEVVNEFCDLLQSHANRDKVVALTSYTLKLWGATSSSQTVMTASARLAGARATLRLFDDAAALKILYNYGLGKHEGPVWGALGVTNSAFTLAYLQAEKLVWLLDTGVLKLSDDIAFNVRTAHKLFWSLSAFLGLIRSIRTLHMAAVNLKSNRTKCAPARFTQAALTSTKFLLDVVHAVSWLPPGWLWGSAMKTSHAASVAAASGVLALVMHYHGRRLLPR
ncbi:peroxisomal membrane protein 11C-like [Leptidea sinapis]|uniref:peroxisomal membrane protein 11C-like n=1 Tax=Leptidea sinapis TaxID=189913 RepID=UPI002130DECB|nr:peroxisomal membrane protein 11C-like [Leptidea sinapis]